MSTKTPVETLYFEDDRQDIDLAEAAVAAACPNHDFRFTVVDTGDRALEYLERLSKDIGISLPDLVILDLNLPKVNGRAILRHLRSSSRLQDVPVVVLTGSAHDGDREETDRLGANLFLEKATSFSGYKDMFRSICGLIPHN